ncbi:MAG: diguanylate cyclase [Psychrobium sp.]|nr:diguanylate cyclase [Psychrobium sp.]
MKFSENSNQAASYLRLAVPMMVKHKIVPNPLNYTLWYSYFSNAFPKLNQELDHVIDRYGTCPSEVSESLFLQFVNQSGASVSDDIFRDAIFNLVGDLSQSIDETCEKTKKFSLALNDNLSELAQYELDDAIKPLVNKLSENASAICRVNEQFQKKIDSAQEEIQSLKTQLEASKKDASTDLLTGLYNRRVLESIYRRYANSSQDLTVIMMDIDKFKLFNDKHGHVMGDQILKVIGKLLQQECLEPVVPVRFGGEEFAVLCPNIDVVSAGVIAENIREKLARIGFSNKRTGEKISPVTASFGIALKQGDEELMSVIERADKALYSAKSNGRNQVKLAS